MAEVLSLPFLCQSFQYVKHLQTAIWRCLFYLLQLLVKSSKSLTLRFFGITSWGTDRILGDTGTVSDDGLHFKI